MNNFIKRTLSGTLFVAIIVGSVLLNQYAFAVVFIFICGFTLHEFHKITNKQTDVEVNNTLAIGGGGILFISTFFYTSKLLPFAVFFMYGL